MNWKRGQESKPEPPSEVQAAPETRSAEEDLLAEIPPPSQLKLERVLHGHSSSILRMAWSPDGSQIGSADAGEVNIWDASGAPLRKIPGNHQIFGIKDFGWSPDSRRVAICNSGSLWVVDSQTGQLVWATPGEGFDGVVWSPNGELIAVGGSDGVVRIFHAADGGLHKNFVDHRGTVFELAWSSDGRLLASAGGGSGGKEYDQGIRIWDTDAWQLVCNLQGHSGYVAGLAWSPLAPILASVSMDRTVRIWNAAEGKLTHTIEVHTSETRGVTFSPDGRVLVSHSWDDTIRFWRSDDLHPLMVVKFKHMGDQIYDRVAFTPDGGMLGAVRGKAILLFRIDLGLITGGESVVDSVRYTTAKLVLVGDSGVGKTGLGWRLSHSEFKEHASTHGQQFWVVDTLRVKRKDGVECEAVLWDLAGQHVYRPVHAIFLERVDLAIMVFDPTNRQDSLKGVEFWLDQLGGKGHLPPAVLVGARLDRGSPVLSMEDLDQFCLRRGIGGGYIGTSAKSGDGIDRLTDALRQLIPWDSAAATVTTSTFKRIKDYVLTLKEVPAKKEVLISPTQLRQKLMAMDAAWRFSEEEMMTAITHLENHGYVAVLNSSAGQKVILLEPTLLPDLASSIVLQADKHPRELGAVNETLLLGSGYPFLELGSLKTSEKEILLDATVVRFLRHNVCFRETIGAETLLIFPNLIKQKRPLRDEVETYDGVSYLVRGRVENLYSALAVLLGYTQTFTRVTQWQNQAQFEFEKGQVCGFRMLQEREGELEFVLYYSASTPAYGRSLFQGLFEKFLYERDVVVERFEPVVCINGHPQERATLVQRRREGKEFMFCGECGVKIVLTGGGAPIPFGTGVSHHVERQEALARLRSSYEANLARVKAFRRDRAAPRCYLSHAGDKAQWVAELSGSLRDAGVYVVEQMDEQAGSDFILLVWTSAYGDAWTRSAEPVASVSEVVRKRLAGPAQPAVIPLLVEGEAGGTLAAGLGGCRASDFRQETRYVLALFDLVLTLYSIPLGHAAFEPFREAMHRQWEETLRSGSEADPTGAACKPPAREVFVSYGWEEESERTVLELEKAFQNRGVHMVRDKRDLGFKGDIRAFMQGIGRGKCVVLILSEKYLQSENCLFELLEVEKRGDFKDRVFPVVLESAKIYKPIDRIRYVQYWEKQVLELDAALKTVSAANLQGFREEIDLYTEIRGALPRLADILKNINALTPKMHRESSYAELIDAVFQRLES